MNREKFEKLVEQAILDLPEKIRSKMNNVEVIVEEEPTAEQLGKIRIGSKYSLLGLYEGVPQNAWGRGFGNILPDKITIFKKAIESHSKSEQVLIDLIKNTVWHEIAHHFGFDEKGVRLLERRKNESNH